MAYASIYKKRNTPLIRESKKKFALLMDAKQYEEAAKLAVLVAITSAGPGKLFKVLREASRVQEWSRGRGS